MQRYSLIFSFFLVSSAFAAGEAATSGVALVYHHVAVDTPPSTTISPESFRVHLEYLRDNDFNVIELGEMVNALLSRQSIPEKSVAITFDDGYSSIYDTAFPMLIEFDFPFTLFVSTGPINRAQSNYMSWENIKEMADAGVTIANHLVEHPYMLDKLKDEAKADWLYRMRQEIRESQDAITLHTGQDNKLLAYPYGEYDNDIRGLSKELGFISFAQNSGAIGFDSDFLALPRFPLASIYANLDTAKVKFGTKAFSVKQLTPLSPVTSDVRPTASLMFSPGDYRLEQITCFSNSRIMDMSWSEAEKGVLTIRPKDDLSERRSRYVCTAPDIRSDRFFWHSVQWINVSN
ncbi:MAG: peptidoglycan/xylan/chitin deacetylase (PgdA/CDA1 family) [Pseudohongiellaceae bacterium]|jgi:peptidoglycan/xylan/chitin deacetylase (PgdA/CDA1 family)